MNSFLIAFAGSIAAGVIATIVSSLFNNHFQVPLKSFSSDRAVLYPHPVRLRIAAFSATLALPSFLVFLASMVMTITDVWRNEEFLWGSFGVYVGFMAVYFALALILRCHKCKKHVLLQWITAPPYGERDSDVDAGVSAVDGIVWKGKFHCMYCGQQYRVGDSSNAGV